MELELAPVECVEETGEVVAAEELELTPVEEEPEAGVVE